MPAGTTAVRGSTRSRAAAAVSRLTLRQVSAVLPPERAWGLWASRQIVAGIMDAFGPPLPAAPVERIDERLPDGRRVVGEWVRADGVRAGPSAVYFLHGSGYAMCSARTHRRLTGWLSALTGLPVFCLDYRLAPRHPFPAAADDAHAGWEWLTGAHGPRLAPENLVIAGDSAGGHLAVDLLCHGTGPHPAALALFSPLIDLTFATARTRERHRRDPAIRADDAARLVQLYCRGIDPAHPRLAHDIASGPMFPPTLIQAGGAEMLAADAVALAEAIRSAGGRCELQIWPDQVHVFQALPRLTPEAAHAMADAATFLTDAVAR
ncbi:MAG: alpha/beta hydrolase fold domain-containing protein [Mycobacterium sp.]|nr:alpha/beta hydrolase fold domain-containing protein [Mycobacterium sp.]